MADESVSRRVSISSTGATSRAWDWRSERVRVAAAGIAKILFYIFLIVFLLTLIMGVGRRGNRV